MRHLLVVRAGEVCILAEWTASDRPAWLRMWWPVCLERNWTGPVIPTFGIPVEENRDGYRFKDGAWSFTITLPDAGRTVASWSEEVAIPAPKTSKVVAWRGGRWARLLAKGWMPCESPIPVHPSQHGLDEPRLNPYPGHAGRIERRS